LNWIEIPIHGRTGIVAWAKVDQSDAENVSRFRWNLQNGYARRGLARIGMHREIVGELDMTVDIDHINGDKLDNRRANLRRCSRSTNRQNSPKPRRSRATSSKYLGVTRKGTSWYVQINVNWKKLSGGYFRDEVEAAKRYDELARLHFGPLARVNFPDESPTEHLLEGAAD
jgi:hypothetical protein